MSSRLFRRTYSHHFVGAFHFISGRCTWVDHEDVLPPYFPIGRGEDFLMGRLLPVLDRRALAVYLPYAFLHLPMPERSPYPSLRYHSPNLNYCHWFGHYLVTTVPTLVRDFNHLSVTEALERAGRDLASWRFWNLDDFSAYAVQIGRNLISRQVAQVQAMIDNHPSISPTIRDDLKWLTDQWCDRLISPQQVFPPDLAEWHPGADWSTLRHWFSLYGEMMAAWPNLRAAAQRLQARGGDWLEGRT